MEKLNNPRKIIFLDRDGVVTLETANYITLPEKITLNGGAMDALKQWKKNGFEFVIITNQAGIAKGIVQEEKLQQIHVKMLELLEKENIRILEVYVCPHFPSVSQCICRKPGSLLIEKALARFGANPKDCFMIGDRERDIEAAHKAGVKGILVESNATLNPDLIFTT